MQFLEIFVTITGLIYLYLEIKQSKWMWWANIVCCSAAATIFGLQSLWANLGLNVLYCVMSVWGIFRYRRDSGIAKTEGIRLRHISKDIGSISAAIACSGGIILVKLLELGGDPSPILDGAVGIMGIIATWWLAYSYAENWIPWILADLLCTILCFTQADYWMGAMYAVYTAASVYGYFKWKREGSYLE